MESPVFKNALKLFRSRVRELRQLHGLSYNELAERSNVNRRQLLAIERDEAINPTLVTLTRLAEAFGVEPRELLAPSESGIVFKARPRHVPKNALRELVDKGESIDILYALTRLAEEAGLDVTELLPASAVVLPSDDSSKARPASKGAKARRKKSAKKKGAKKAAG